MPFTTGLPGWFPSGDARSHFPLGVSVLVLKSIHRNLELTTRRQSLSKEGRPGSEGARAAVTWRGPNPGPLVLTGVNAGPTAAHVRLRCPVSGTDGSYQTTQATRACVPSPCCFYKRLSPGSFCECFPQPHGSQRRRSHRAALAGLIDDGEDPKAAALRELEEETGYKGEVAECSPGLCLLPGCWGWAQVLLCVAAPRLWPVH